MKKNVGRMDAYARIACGVFGVAWGTARMVRKPRQAGPVMVTMMSAIKVAEGITRFCPMLYAMGIDTLDKKNNNASENNSNNQSPNSNTSSEGNQSYSI